MKPETLGEVAILFQNLNSRFDALEHKLEENTKVTNLVLAQATKTNGRVNTMEPIVMEYQESRAKLRGMITLLTVTGGMLLAVAGFTVKLYIDNTVNEITNKVTTNIQK